LVFRKRPTFWEIYWLVKYCLPELDLLHPATPSDDGCLVFKMTPIAIRAWANKNWMRGRDELDRKKMRDES
jgi:hypothetical protein